MQYKVGGNTDDSFTHTQIYSKQRILMTLENTFTGKGSSQKYTNDNCTHAHKCVYYNRRWNNDGCTHAK